MIIRILIQSVVSIIVLFVLAKWIGCRQISEMSMFDYINGITIGSIAAEVAITEENMWPPLIAMVIYGTVTALLSWLSDKSMTMRRFIIGRPYILFQNGEFFYKNMKKNKIDLHEFMTACRVSGYFDLSEIESAIYENNGRISFLPKSENRPLMPKDLDIKPETEYVFANVILEGKIMHDNLKNMGRDENWLKKQMQIHNIKDEKDVFLAIADGNDKCYFFKKSDGKSQDVLI